MTCDSCKTYSVQPENKDTGLCIHCIRLAAKDRQITSLEGNKQAVIDALDGVTDYEGLPITEHNYLQGIRKLKETQRRENSMSGTKGEVDYAIRRALNIFDNWNNCTGFVPKFTGYYYELQSVIEDAVHCGFQQALGDEKKLDSEIDGWKEDECQT